MLKLPNRVRNGDGMSRQVRIELGFLPPEELRGNSRAHWAVKARRAKDMRQSGMWHGRHNCMDLHHLPKVSIKYTFHNYRNIDLDNLVIGMKNWADGCLVDGEVVESDDPEHVRIEAPEFVKVPKGEERTIIEITEVVS